MRHVNNEKCQTTHDGGVKLLNQVVIRMLGEKKTYEYLGILEADTNKQENSFKKEYLRRTRELLETNSIAGTLSKG